MALKMFRERNPIPLGAIAIVWLAFILAAVFNMNAILSSFGASYRAEIAEAAGLKVGDPVRVSGLDVGRVNAVELGEHGGGVIVEFSVTNDEVQLGSETTARVSVETVLGDKALVLTSKGDGGLDDGETIPLARTSVPYDVNDALGDLTEETGAIDIEKVSEALDVVSATVDGAAPELRSAVQGIGRISQTINKRDEALLELLDHADSFSEVLADRSGDMNQLIRDGNVLFAELAARREQIQSLLRNISAMSRELKGFVRDNEATLGPALDQLNGVLKTLQSNKKNLSQSLRGLSIYATGLGEVVASGEFFTAYVQNLAPGNFVPPAIDLDGLGLDGLLRGGVE